MAHRKGGFLGSVPLGAGAGQFVLPLASAPAGVLAGLLLRFTFNGCISTGAAFNVSSTGAQGDDVDKLLDDAMTDMSLYLDNKVYLFSKRLPDEVRSAIMFLRAGFDYQGSFFGASIPVSTGSAKSFTILAQIPFACAQYFRDGDIMGQGSSRLRLGGRLLLNAAKQANAGLVLTNGTMAYTSWTCDTIALPGSGPSSQVGPNWRLEVVQGYPNNYALDPATDLLVAYDDTPSNVTTAGVSSDGITIQGQDIRDLVGPDQLPIDYINDHPLVGGAVNPTNRKLPFVWLPNGTAVEEVPAPMRTTIRIPQLPTLSLFTIVVDPAPSDIVAGVAARVGGGGAVAAVHPPVKSLPPGSAFSPGAAAWMPVATARPGTPAAQGGIVHSSPASLAATHALRIGALGQPALGGLAAGMKFAKR